MINNFPYIMALPAAAAILGMQLPFWLTLWMCLSALLLVWVFWKASVLDRRTEQGAHPHHARWGLVSISLKPVSLVLSKFPPWSITLIFWAAVTLTVWGARQTWISAAGVYPFWLLYIPVVIWPGYKLERRASEWFAIAWIASAAVYAAAYLWAANFEFSWAVISSLASGLVWFFFLSIFIHYLFRRLAIFRCQSEFLQQLIEQFRMERGYSQAFDARPITSSPDEHLNQIAWAIGSKLMFERVFIHILDPENGRLFMKGRYANDLTGWPELGWSIQDQESITGWVARNRQAHLCGDTSRCTLYFDQNRNTLCRSEAAVPIIVENQVVGIIDVESSYRNAFDTSDLQLLWQVANSIGAALAYERHVTGEVQKAYKLMEDTALKMVTARSLDEALEQIAEQARAIFGADLVTIYKHAVSTMEPLPGLIFRGEAKFPDLLGQKIPANARVNDLLRREDDLYIQPITETDDLLLGPNRGEYHQGEKPGFGSIYRFVRREGIKSTVYIKLGLGQEVVGSLFLNYRQRTYFQKNQIDALRAFAKTLALALILKRQVERSNGPLSGAIPLSHSQAEAAFESASRKFNEIHLESLEQCPSCQELRQELEEFSARLNHLKREWNTLILVEQRMLRSSSLAEPIAHLESKLRTMFPGVQLKWNVQDFLRIPADEFGDVLYKVIAEAVSNALVHGETTRIEVKSSWTDNQVVLSIRNNGIPIDAARARWMNELFKALSDPSATVPAPGEQPNRLDKPHFWEDQEKNTGIVPILLDAWRWFGASWDFSQDEAANTLITVAFPLGQKFTWTDEEDEDALESEI